MRTYTTAKLFASTTQAAVLTSDIAALESFVGELLSNPGIVYVEMVLHFQPKIDFSSNSVSGVEALVRWQHPRLGLLYPDMFIRMAEASGLN